VFDAVAVCEHYAASPGRPSTDQLVSRSGCSAGTCEEGPRDRTKERSFRTSSSVNDLINRSDFDVGLPKRESIEELRPPPELGQQDLKMVIARTSPVWRTVARCWRNRVVLVSEHYIDSFRQKREDAHQKNQGCRITHACRSTASDGYEKIRLTATSLGRRLASLLGKLPTPRAHETPPEGGAL